MDYVSISSISFLFIAWCICTCALNCIPLRNKPQNNTHEYSDFPQMLTPPQYEITDTSNTNTINTNTNDPPPPPYKLESDIHTI